MVDQKKKNEKKKLPLMIKISINEPEIEKETCASSICSDCTEGHGGGKD